MRILMRWRTWLAVARLVPWYAALAVSRHVVPLPVLARWMSLSHPRRQRSSTPAPVIASRVLRASALVGIPDRDCLQRSLLLYRELQAGGFFPELVVGLCRDAQPLAGHAWVTLDGRTIGEPDLDASRFTTVLRFGDRGRPLLDATAPV